MFKAATKYLPNTVVNTLTSTYFKTQAYFGTKHNCVSTVQLEKMKVRVLPALSDNYMYLIMDENTNQAAIVDPVAPDVVLRAVEEEGVNLTKILTTHHHWDHAGGNKALVQKCKNALQVFGGDQRIDAITNEVAHGDKFTIGDIQVECIFTPCHTKGHICYHLTAAGQTPAVFTGDTLFVAGCGRFFEGTAEEMHSALIDKLGALSDNTYVFCGHEYTMQNLKFAQHVEKDNTDILQRIQWADDRRKNNEPTVPSTIGDEKKTNPFMRVGNASVQKHAGTSTAIETMAAIRKEKDNFK